MHISQSLLQWKKYIVKKLGFVRLCLKPLGCRIIFPIYGKILEYNLEGYMSSRRT